MQAVFGMFKHDYDLKFGQSKKFCDSVSVHRVSPLEKLLSANKTLPDRGKPGVFLFNILRLLQYPSTFSRMNRLSYACCDEMKDLTLFEALHRLLTLALEKVRSTGEFAESVVNAMLDAVMGTAVAMIKSSQKANALAT